MKFGAPEERPGRVIRLVYGVAGTLAVLIAAVTLPIPGFPSSLFFLGGLLALARSSPRFGEWVERHPKLGPFVERLRKRFSRR